MVQLADDGVMVDLEHSYDDITSIIRDFKAFVEMIQEVNQVEARVPEYERKIADFSCSCALRLADQYLCMKKNFCLCKDDEMLTSEKDIRA